MVLLFAVVLLASSAVPVLAADPPSEAASSVELPAASEEGLPQVPDEQDVREGLEAAEQREAERERWLESPEAVREREESRLAYADLFAAQAEALLKSVFADQLAAIDGDPARLLSGEQLVQPLGEDETVATVKSDGDSSVLDAGIPVRVEGDEDGELHKVDLSLEAMAGGYETRNALSDVYVPDSAAEPIEIGEEGLSIAQLGADASRGPDLFGDKTAYYHDVLPSTGLMVAPIAGGADLLNVLYSEESPETLRYDLELPKGAELRPDGIGGAEISRDGKQLAYIPFPTAVDAQGTRVPVEMSVDGTTLVVNVAHRDRDYAMPILLDPAIHENYEATWYWGSNLDSLNTPNVWRYSTNDPSENYYVHNTYCLSAELCSPSGRGLFMLAYPDTYPSNVYGHWWYYVPGGTSYIPSIYPEPSAAFNPYWRHNHNCTWEQHKWPYDYNGSFDAAGNWQWFETDRAQWYGHAVMYTKAKGIAVGMSSGGGSGWTPCWRSIMLGGAAVRLDDPENPTLHWASGSSGWAGDSTPVSITASASDPGLGVYSFWISPQGTSPFQRTLGCWGTMVKPCSSGSTPTFKESAGLFDEGEREVQVSATDPTGKYSGTVKFNVKVDRTPPMIDLNGQLAKATKEVGSQEPPEKEDKAEELSLPVYNLAIKAEDGSKEPPSAKRSGVKDIEVLLDGKKQEVPWKPLPSCPETSCSMKVTYPLQLTGLADGEHVLKIFATDFMGEKEERSVEFKYIPATGMKEEYVLQRFPLPDGADHEGELVYHGPELAVNVMNGNLVYHERDVNVEGHAADLEVERYYNSQLPTAENTEWGDGWTLAQTPDLKLEEGEEEAPPAQASMVRRSGVLQSAISLPTTGGGTKFDPKLQAMITKENGGYTVSDESGQTPGDLVFDEDGRTVELRADSHTKVEYDYEGGALSEISIDDPGTFAADPKELEIPQPKLITAPTYANSFGVKGAGNGQLKLPADVEVDPATGELLVVDRENNRIQRFSPEGKYLTQFGTLGSGNGQLKGPRALTIDPKGNLWVADSGNRRVQKLGAKGEFKCATPSSGEGLFSSWGSKDVAVDASGNLWATDYSGIVRKFNESCGFVQAIGSSGTGKGQFSESAGIDVAAGKVWVSDWVNDRLSVFSEAGEFLFDFGTSGSGNGQLNGPDGVEIDGEGNVWILDVLNSRVQRFDQTGKYQNQFGSSGSGEGQFSLSWPANLTTDGKGHLWVADVNNYRVQEWMLPVNRPTYASSFGTKGSGDGQLNLPADVAVGLGDNLWVADKANNRVQKFDPTGKFLAKFGAAGAGDGQLSGPAAITVDRDGNLLVGDSGNRRVQKFSPDGKFLAKFGSHGTGPGQFTTWGPKGIAVDAQEDIWVTDYSCRVQEFDATGQFLRSVGSCGSGNGQFSQSAGIDVGRDGRIWVSDWVNHRVSVFDEEGKFLFSFGGLGSGPGQLNHPDSVEVDAKGNVWVGDQSNNRVQLFDSEAKFVAQFGTYGSGPGQFNFTWPQGVETDLEGRIWVADPNNHRVQHWLYANYAPAGEMQIDLTDGDPAVDIETESGLVASVSGNAAGEHDYVYSGNDLVSHDGPGGETAYEYDPAGRMTKVTLPNGTWGQIAYYTDGRVKSVTVDPADSPPSKTTKFEYTDAAGPEEARSTLVIPDGEVAITYDIGADGSVLRWSNTDEPPKFTDRSGALYVERETAQAISAGDKTLLFEARSNEGIESIQFIANGNTLVDELTCEQTEEKGIECKEVKNEWVTNTADLTPGILQLEVVAEDRDEDIASERFWVNIPYTPPPGPDEIVPPKFKEVLTFRKEYGLDLDLDPVADELELNDRIFDLIGAWHNPQTPLGEVARASWERWGVPLRPVDVAEMGYREWYMAVNIPLIEEWAESHRPTSFAGYYLDHPAGGTLHVGFTQDQANALTELKQQVSPAAPERLDVYPTIPTESRASLKATLQGVETAWSTDGTLAALINSAGVDEVTDTVEVTGTDPGQIDSRLKTILGHNIPIRVLYEPAGLEYDGRNHTTGRIQSGDRIIGSNPKGKIVASGCTAGFGAWDKIGTKPNGDPKIAPFVLTAGHCARPGYLFYRTPTGGPVNTDTWRKFGHTARTGLPQGGQHYETDGSAIRLEGGGLMPYYTFMNGQSLKPTEPAGRAHHGETLCFSGAGTNETKRCGEFIGVRVRQTPNPGRQLFLITRFAGNPGDSGAPVWSPRLRRSIGLVSGGPHGTGLVKDWVTPLLLPRGHDPEKIPGILNAPGMGSLQLAVPGG